MFFRNPTPNKNPWLPVKNLKNHTYLKNEDLYYLNITGPYDDDNKDSIKMEMSNNLYKDRMQFIEQLPLLENVENIL